MMVHDNKGVTPDMIQHQSISTSIPTIIAEIIQMNSVLKFFCRDGENEIIHARCLPIGES